MERRTTNGPHRVRVDTGSDGKRTITGYAAVFYDGTPATEFDLGYGMLERIAPSAFDSALSRPDDVRALFNHDASAVLGRTVAGTLRLEVDKVGLRYTIDVPDSPTGNDVAVAVQRQDVTGSSFAFIVGAESWARDEQPAGERWIRTVTDLSQLFDVGPATYPAYAGTTAAARSGEAQDALEALRKHKARIACATTSARLRAIQTLVNVGNEAGWWCVKR